MASNWYIKKDQGEIGPKVFSELVELIRADELTESDLVRSEWNTEWQRADKIVGLFYMARKSKVPAVVESPPTETPIVAPVDAVETELIELADAHPGWMQRLLYLMRLQNPLEPADKRLPKQQALGSVTTKAGPIEAAAVQTGIVRPSLSPADLARESVEFAQDRPEFVREAFEPETDDTPTATTSKSTAEIASHVDHEETAAACFDEASAPDFETSTSGLSGAIDAAVETVDSRSERRSRSSLVGRLAGASALPGWFPARAVFRLVIVLACAALTLNLVNGWSTLKLEQVERNTFIVRQQLSRGIRNGRRPELVDAIRRKGPIAEYYFPLIGGCSRIEYLALLETLAVVVAIVAYQAAKLIDSSLLTRDSPRRTAFS